MKACKTKISYRIAAAAVWLTGFGVSAAQAQTITLRIADSLPSGHIIHKILTKPFIEGVDRESKGKIKVQHFPGEQLGKAKDLLMLTQSGVADIGYIAPSYQSEKMPLSSALELPDAFGDYCQGTRALWALTHNGGYLETKEFKPNHVIPLVTLMLPTYQILIASGKKVESLKDLNGLKMRSAGGAMDFLVKRLNMVPVRMTPPEVYESLSRGTIDGAIFPYQSAVSYGIFNMVKSGTTKENFGTVVITYSIGENKWKQLPESVRATLTKVGREMSMAACQRFIDEENGALSKTIAQGMKPIVFSAADRRTLESHFASVAHDWAGSLDARGKPGSETLAAVKKALTETK